MECKKCKKEFLETELVNGICQTCKKVDKNFSMSSTIKMTIISSLISIIITLIIVMKVNSEVSLSDFKLDSFNLNTEKDDYSTSYTGEGIINCSNTKYDYEVLVEEYENNSKETTYNTVIVHNGKGKFMTYDSTYSGAKEKPNYSFRIIGYRSFKNN